MIYIIDFGSQVTQLIARRVREQGVYCEIISHKNAFKVISKIKTKGIILSGGPASVHVSNTPKLDKRVYNLGVPILGICYGMQLLVSQLGGKVSISSKREFGKTLIKTNYKNSLFRSLKQKGEKSLNVWMLSLIHI